MIYDLKEGDSGKVLIMSKFNDIPLGIYDFFVDGYEDILVLSRGNKLRNTTNNICDSVLIEKCINKDKSFKTWDWIFNNIFDQVEIFVPASKAMEILYGDE